MRACWTSSAASTSLFVVLPLRQISFLSFRTDDQHCADQESWKNEHAGSVLSSSALFLG